MDQLHKLSDHNLKAQLEKRKKIQTHTAIQMSETLADAPCFFAFLGWNGRRNGLNADVGNNNPLGPGHTSSNLAHYSVWAHACANYDDSSWVAVFEGDATLKNESSDHYTEVMASLSDVPSDSQILYLYAAEAAWYDKHTYRLNKGVFDRFWKNTSPYEFIQMQQPLTLCAVVYKVSFLKKIEKHLYSPIDWVVVQSLQKHKVPAYASYVFDHGSFSSGTAQDSGKW